jgi:hypothetical protein
MPHPIPSPASGGGDGAEECQKRSDSMALAPRRSDNIRPTRTNRRGLSDAPRRRPEAGVTERNSLRAGNLFRPEPARVCFLHFSHRLGFCRAGFPGGKQRTWQTRTASVQHQSGNCRSTPPRSFTHQERAVCHAIAAILAAFRRRHDCDRATGFLHSRIRTPIGSAARPHPICRRSSAPR